MNRPTLICTIARWLSRCLSALVLAVTLTATYHTPQPRPDPDVTQSSPDRGGADKGDKGDKEDRVNWNS